MPDDQHRRRLLHHFGDQPGRVARVVEPRRDAELRGQWRRRLSGALGRADEDRRRRLLGEEIRQQRSEEHTSELQSLMRTAYAVFCLKKNLITRQCALVRTTTYTRTHTVI